MSHLSQPGAVLQPVPMTVLFDSTLSGAAATIDSGSSGFSIGYNHLRVVLYLRTAEAVVQSSVAITINNDGGSNYDIQRIRNVNTTVTGNISLARVNLLASCPGASAEAGAYAAVDMLIPAYAQTTGHKALTWTVGGTEDTAADCVMEQGAGRWKSTAAVNRIIVAGPGANNLAAGSRMTVYGL